ncbi:MAG TPA: hypothetical protein VN758_09525 [Solirubrobacterales bacterium]|nr:hypothetical protein [Solirubrobacterales bacterium]
MGNAEDRLADRGVNRGAGTEGVDVHVAFGTTGSRRAGIGDVEAPAAAEVRRRDDREQAALAFAAGHKRADVGDRGDHACGDFIDYASALGDEQAFGVSRVRGDRDRPFEFADRLERGGTGGRAEAGRSED